MSDSHSRDLLTDGSRWLTLRTELKLNCWRRVPLSLQRTSLFYLSFSFFSYPIVFMLAPLRTRETDRCPVETDAVPPADDKAPDSADPNFRPKLNESDRESLRKRKGALDAAFADAE